MSEDSDARLRLSFPAEGVGLLTLNRPATHNAIDMMLAGDLAVALDDLARNDDVRAIVLTGAGARAFSAGYDIREMSAFDASAMTAAFVARDPLLWQVANHPKPIIAAINGIAYGAGALLAAAADLRVGSPAMAFKVTAASYGSANATWSLPPIVGVARAKDILMTGRVVGGQEAAALGLLTQLVDEGCVLDAAVALARSIAAHPADGVQGIKMLVNAGIGRAFVEARNAEFAFVAAQTAAFRASGERMFGKFLDRHAPRAAEDGRDDHDA